MRGKTLDSGGRIASSYVAKKLTEALHRLGREQFAVRMTIDRASAPFAVTFERLENPKSDQRSEAGDRDLAGELVREFLFFAHGVPREHKRTRITEADRAAAKAWLDAYGFEKSMWMVQRCLKIQKERGAVGILVFRGLQLYESTASGAYEHHIADEASRIERQFSEELDTYWGMYRKKLVELFDTNASADELVLLDREGREEVGREKPDSPAYIQDALLRAHLSALKCQRMNALNEGEFRAHRGLRTLRDALIERHAVDLLESSSGGTEGQGALPVA